MGGYLRNPVRDAGGTCGVCTIPIEPQYDLCARCLADNRHHNGDLANLIIPLYYAIEGRQSARLMYGYKDPINPVRKFRTHLTLLLIDVPREHERCIEQRIGRPIDVWTAVPSTKARPGRHPLIQTIRSAKPACPQVTLTTNPPGNDDPRATVVNRFDVAAADDIRGKHVLIIDDTWVQGGHVQSAALTLRTAGASAITVLVFERWIKPTTPLTRRFIAELDARPYDPALCPISGGECPAGPLN